MTENSANYEPDFIERNGAWVLSMLGVVLGCVSAILAYFLKSRCTKIKCCGAECTRDVLDLERVPEQNMQFPAPTPSRMRRSGISACEHVSLSSESQFKK